MVAELPLIEEEASFQEWLFDTLRTCGWEYHHETDSRKSKRGFPDIIAWRGPRLLFAELKRVGETPTLPQRAVLKGLSQTCAEVYLWTPIMRNEIMRILQ